MNKITNSAILALVLTTTSIEAGSWYLGLEQSLINDVENTTTAGSSSTSRDKSLTISSIKIGHLSEGNKGNHYEFVYNTGEKSVNPVGGLYGSNLTSLSFNWNLTASNISPVDEILPYFRLGVNYSISDDKYSTVGTGDRENYSAFGIILGIGSYYSLNEHLNLAVGFDYGYRKWRTLTTGWTDIESTDKIKKLYVGVDYLF